MALERYFVDFTERDWERESVSGTVRMAVVGVGGFARERALPAIDASAYTDATVLVSGSPDSTREVADEFGVEHVIGYDAFLDGVLTDTYDAVYVATPNAFHGRYATAAADYGKHVICEKPLETTPARAREVVDACAEAGVTLMTAYRLQCEPTVRRTRELVRDGVIGDVVQIHGGFSNPLLANTTPDTWRLDADLAGGGALVDLGVYPLNTVRFVLDTDPVSVYASTTSTDDAFAAVDQHVAFQLEFPGGATASCTASFDAHANSQLQLIGTEGSVWIASPFGGVVPHEIVVESGDMCMEYTGRPTDEVREEFAYFGYCVLTETTPEPDGHDGLTDAAIIDAAYDAAGSDRRVELV
ncbi:D-xylose 1-dehydrogenase Gfo6 [Natronobiforma cellulositropha]|uniref:D-xylose 1-dehydrogenase Gfo6 n=1 Tax=Natronobiforma cellulositropha TaxID=1679076 RepID=UPI0021D5B210|nr:D-xylose 1-dehydrogenase Gfo6 [Natronobiforma cellulositropha]